MGDYNYITCLAPLRDKKELKSFFSLTLSPSYHHQYPFTIVFLDNKTFRVLFSRATAHARTRARARLDFLTDNDDDEVVEIICTSCGSSY